jgi:deoxyribodipyrimidine photolyase-like uncharacterized protein
MTTLYWNLLHKHQTSFEKNPRTKLMVVNLKKIEAGDQALIAKHAKKILNDLEAI